MVDIPISLDISTIDSFSLCLFKDTHHAKNAPHHYYIIIPTDTSYCFVICLISSQIEKRVSYYTKNNQKCLQSLVMLDGSELKFLTKPSVIDCNNAEYVHKRELLQRIAPGTYKKINENIPTELREKIIAAIDSSPKVKPFVKQSIKLNQE